MEKIPQIILITILFPVLLFSQKDFNKFYDETNPIRKRNSDLTEIAQLEKFSREVESQKDTLLISLSKIYLSEYYYFRGDYEMATRFLIEAQNLSEKINHQLLTGRILHKKGSIYTAMNDYDSAIELFNQSLELSTIEKDSQFISITLEQLGSLYGYKKEKEMAFYYFDMAIPLIKKYWPIKDLAVSYSNFGNVLSILDSSEAAITYYQKALEINEKNNYTSLLVPCLQNLADEYFYLDSLEKALAMVRKAKVLNDINNWPRYQINNYSIQAKIFEEKGELDSAIHYLKQKLELSDSVIGPTVQLKIAELHQLQESSKKDKNFTFQLKDLYYKNQNLTSAVLLSSALFLLFLSLYVFLRKRNKKFKEESQATLNRLTTLLEKKRHEIADIKRNQTGKIVQETKESLFDPISLRILTNEDWDFFKNNFQESNPGFIQNLRSEYPGLTDAEERLFLLLSLNLKTGELANILGVQKETIKKTRSRLRKRLALGTDDSLEDYVKSYSTYNDK